MLEKGLSLLKKIRQIAGKPRVWGAIAIFSPTLVACYGMPYDCNDGSYDCINGYVGMCEQGALRVKEDVDPATTMICHERRAYENGSAFQMGTCTKDGFVDSGTECQPEDVYRLNPSDPAKR